MAYPREIVLYARQLKEFSDNNTLITDQLISDSCQQFIVKVLVASGHVKLCTSSED